MDLDRKQILKLWDKIKPIAKLGELLFTGQDMVACSNEVLVICPFETEFRGLVSHKEFIGLLKRTKADMVKTSLNGAELHLKAPGVKSVLKIEPEHWMLDLIREAVEEAQEDEGWMILKRPEEFRFGLNLCANHASKRLEQNIAYVLVSNNRIVSTDDFRISLFKLNEPFDARMMIRAPNCKLITKFKFDQYAIKDKWVHLSDPDDTLICVRSTGIDYVEVDDHFNFEGYELTLPTGFTDKLEQISPFFQGKDIEQNILLSLEKGRVVLHAKKDIGWAETICPARNLNPKRKVAFNVNPAYLSEIIEITGCTLKIGEDRALFQKDNFSHLLGLSRL